MFLHLAALCYALESELESLSHVILVVGSRNPPPAHRHQLILDQVLHEWRFN